MSNTYLTKTYAQNAGNRKKFTVSAWFKRSKLGATQDLISAYRASDGFQTDVIRFGATDDLEFYAHSTLGNSPASFQTVRLFRDTSAWYHVVVMVDTTESAGTDRFKLYVNGERIMYTTGFTTENYPVQNDEMVWGIGSGVVHTIGAVGTANYFDGSASHIHYCDGYAYNANNFGETDTTTGEWKAKTSPSVTYGTNGFFILKDSNLVTDQSGRGNNFAVGGGTLTKTEDCPDNVFSTCSKEPMRRLSGTYVKPVLSNGNTTWDATGADVGATVTLSNLGATTGKYYMEAKVGGSYADSSRIGVGTHENYNGTTFFNSTSSNYVSYTANGEKNIAGTTSSYGASYTVGDIISVALDCDNNTVTFYKNGASQGAINIANNDNFKHFSCGGYDATGSNITNWICNFGNGYFGTTAVSSAGTNASGNGIFEFDVPTNYTALSTKGLNL